VVGLYKLLDLESASHNCKAVVRKWRRKKIMEMLIDIKADRKADQAKAEAD
jgi:hypothetical protein